MGMESGEIGKMWWLQVELLCEIWWVGSGEFLGSLNPTSEGGPVCSPLTSSSLTSYSFVISNSSFRG